MASSGGSDPTRDAFLGGKVLLWQPRLGYRAGLDAVLLAASVPARPGQSVLDLGCGVGAAGLCLAARVPGLAVTGVERAADYHALALRNGLDCVRGDVAALPAPLRQRVFDHVIANPPYFDRSQGALSEAPLREAALGEDTPLELWIEVAAKRLSPKGYLHLIHRMPALPRVLAAAQTCLGALEVQPLAPRAGRGASLFILRARKQGRAPFRLHPAIALHSGSAHVGDAPDYTPQVESATRCGAALIW